MVMFVFCGSVLLFLILKKSKPTMKLSTLVVTAAAVAPAAVVALQQAENSFRPTPFGGNRHWASGGAGQKVAHHNAKDPPPEPTVRKFGAQDQYVQASSFGGNRPFATGGAGIGSSRGISGQPTYSVSNAPEFHVGENEKVTSAPRIEPSAKMAVQPQSPPDQSAYQESNYFPVTPPPSSGSFGGNRPWATGGAGIGSSNGISGLPTYSTSNDWKAPPAGSFGGNRPWAHGGAGIRSSHGIVGEPTFAAEDDMA